MADKTALIKEAQKYLAKGQLDKAIAGWEKIVKEYPDGNNYNFIGDLYLKKGDKKSAIDSYHKAANFFRHEGFSLKTTALLKKVLTVSANDTGALYTLGELSEEKELITDAIKYYLAAADSLSKEGKKDKLLDIYEKILSLSPANISLRTKVAEIFLKEGLKSDAAKEYMHIARICSDKGDIQKSIEHYQKTIDLQPMNQDAIMGLSLLHEKTGNMEKATELMKDATVLFHDSVDVLMRAAELTLAGGDAGDSKAYLARVIERDPKHTKAHRLLGEIYLKEGLKENAWQEYIVIMDEILSGEEHNDVIQLLESFREIDPVETGKRLISLYKQTGDGPRVAEELTSLGDIYYDRGIQNEALACYDEALELSPDNDYLQERTAELKGEMPGESTGLPEPFVPESEPLEAVEGEISEHLSVKAEKTVDEIFSDADVFFKYGLLFEARKLLEGLKLRVPDNIDLHLRLKAIYSDIGDKESAVSECLLLNELYSRGGDNENSQKMLGEAYEISPSDPRLPEKEGADLLETTAFPAVTSEELISGGPEEEALVEDYEEKLAEADFYARQGLIQEALKILLNMQRLFPENKDVAERLESLGGGAEISYTTQMPGTTEIPEMSVEISGAESESPEAATGGKALDGQEISEKEFLEKGPDEELKEEEFEDLSISEHEIIDAQEMPEAALDTDVLEVFQEFKKGLEAQLEDEDSETHYNLGIAYKEMGLVDDAIKEFQTAKDDKKRFLQSSSMLGVCYMGKGLYSLAIDVLTKALESIKEQNEAYWSIKYELAEAYEKNNNLTESLALYTEVYGWNAKFRDVSEKVSLLKTQISKTAGKEKPKERKDRVSYL